MPVNKKNTFKVIKIAKELNFFFFFFNKNVFALWGLPAYNKEKSRKVRIYEH